MNAADPSPLATLRRRVELQGFLDLDDDTLARVGPWLRLAPAICATWVAAGLVLWSPAVVLGLVPMAALGATLRNHPFDLIYDRLVRPRTGGPRIPRYRAPRRFACGVGTLWLLGLAGAMVAGPAWLGRFLAIAFVVTALIPATTDFCIPSWTFARLFGHPAERRARGESSRSTRGGLEAPTVRT
jgi:hypothetical protein